MRVVSITTVRQMGPVSQANEVTTVPCGACGQSFTAKCGRDTMVLLIKHLQENMADEKHRAEFEWAKNEVLSLKVGSQDSPRKFSSAAWKILAGVWALILMALFLWVALHPKALSHCRPGSLMPPPPCSASPDQVLQ